jgi:hypothetical protein
MALSAALLTLLLPAVAQAGLDLAHTVERFPLKEGTKVLAVRTEPIARRVIVETPGVAALATQLRAASRTLCTEVSVRDGAIVLQCASRFISAALVTHAGVQSIEIRLLRVAPWSGRDGLPLVPFDPYRLDLGASCPGDTPAGIGECALAAGQLQEAVKHFQEAIPGPGAALAALRLGDLAAHGGELAEAVRHWRQVPPRSPYGRLAAIRMCETEPNCLPAGRSSILYDVASVPAPLRPDVMLRRARVEAFDGRSLEGAQALAGEHAPGSGCAAEPVLCGDILLDALKQPNARGTQALAIYLAVPSRDRGPLAVELARAASDRSLASGAPVFAATLLSVVSSAVPPRQLSDHLARTAELYLEGGDPVRATVVLEFARTRLSRPELASARWSRLATAASRRPVAKATPPRPEFPGLETDLANATRAVDAAREKAPGSPP